ncbi:MAG: UDP-4-amino-4,6-dideoxy-N-acetyl-beta-L-altrosamine transaminase [Spirochaetaceae bacterium]|nr:UDP-4-amino-4,6-dideoxy-N-acetyl-beta-L-altrosamine transaminase [Spirochaetaceae bacterium]|tara:strand:+ start:34267 stop:35442 length:1176 start_codon:yes stop_codon:yes gene_type:complete
MIPYGRQNITQQDIDAVVEVLKSDFLTQGTVVPAFEDRIRSYTGARHAVAVNSGTSALHIACLALGVGPGDSVWTSPISFVASSNCALYCGASVDFVDIELSTYNIDVAALEEKLHDAKKVGKLPKVVIPVHLAGQSCNMEAVHRLGREFGFRIIEDASHAIGATYKGEPVGNCRFSDIAVFSFHPVKIITTGEGGMAVTNDLDLYNRMARLRSHGVTRDPAEMSKVPDGPWYYEQLELGYNYRMTDIQGALGISQMDRLDQYVDERWKVFDQYQDLLKDLDLILPVQLEDTRSALHLFIIRIPPDNRSLGTRNELFERLRTNGIIVNLHYIPIYRQPYYERFGFSPVDFPASEHYYSEAISLPIFPGLTSEQLQYIKEVIVKKQGHQTLF